MKKRYTRDQEIDLMVNARTRLEGYMARWLSVPQIKQAIQRPEDASKRFNNEKKVKRVRCA